jgi:hypothetical protein
LDDAKILAIKARTSIQLAACPVSPPALFVPGTSGLILLKWIFVNNLLRLDIYGN